MTEYVLSLCTVCNQMTNHINGACLKCGGVRDCNASSEPMKDNEGSEAKHDNRMHGFWNNKPNELKTLVWKLDRDIWAKVEVHEATQSWGRQESAKLILEYVTSKDQTIADLRAEVERLKAWKKEREDEQAQWDKETEAFDNKFKTKEETEAYLKAEGYDPEKLAEQGVVFVHNLMELVKAQKELTTLRDRNAKMEEALSELVHLHICEQEGLQSGMPTPVQWTQAVDTAATALNQKPE